MSKLQDENMPLQGQDYRGIKIKGEMRNDV